MRAACAVVLAGGRSARFGSDKALALLRGEPLVARAVRGLIEAGFAQIAIAAKEPERYAVPGAESVKDGSPLQTPLAGLEAGLRASRHELVFACAADMPFAADAALLDALFAAMPGYDAVMPAHGGTLQSLCGLWRRAPALTAAGKVLALGPAGPRRILEELRWLRLDWPDEKPFLDADTPEALGDLETK